MAYPSRICVVCSEPFELKPDKPGFANQCPACSSPKRLEPWEVRRANRERKRLEIEAKIQSLAADKQCAEGRGQESVAADCEARIKWLRRYQRAAS
jgi:DNA-directed RNA polymerase subunit RPC12/RpoP